MNSIYMCSYRISPNDQLTGMGLYNDSINDDLNYTISDLVNEFSCHFISNIVSGDFPGK